MADEPQQPSRDSDSSDDLPVPVRADANPGLVATAKFLRGLLPGSETPSDALTTAGQLRRRLSTQLSSRTAERPSAMSELGLGALQAWEALSEAQRRRRGDADVAILFTDLVGFSSWALTAGDESAIKLLNEVGAAEGDAIADKGGVIVKRLGDGSMAVFGNAGDAVRAAHDALGRLGEIEVDRYTPTLRAGVHLGQPRKVGKDYLGVDVNIAARVGEAAQGNEILVSNATSEKLDAEAFEFGRTKRLKAEGAPEELVVCAVTPRL